MAEKSADQLQKQIDRERATIRSEGYSISIGELASMYREDELNIRPEFQRVYRWDDERKSKFIESILLGIPIPSIFVAQQDDGVWDVVDGLQRLSTVFQMMGILRDADRKRVPPLVLTRTKYLPALEGMRWDDPKGKNSLTSAQKRFLKRAKLDVKIVLRESSEKTKFELFQRLNTGGAELSEQEIRNAMLVAANQPFYDWLKGLAKFDPFVEVTALTERPLLEQFDVELVLRFIIFRTLDTVGLKSVGDLGDFITDKMMEISSRFKQIKDDEETAFKEIFTIIRDRLGSDAFHKYDSSKQRFLGGFSISAYEIIAFGLGYNVDSANEFTSKELRRRVQEMWDNPAFYNASGSGIRASSRIPKTIPLGRKIFKP